MAVAACHQVVSKFLGRSDPDQTRPLSSAPLINQKRKKVDRSLRGIHTARDLDLLDGIVSGNLRGRGTAKFF
jgi:hypothetical protein